MRALLIYVTAFFAVWSAATNAAQSAEIAVALTDDRVEVDADFSGAAVTMFGAVTGAENPADTFNIIAVVTGPPGDFHVRPLEKRGIIWLPGKAEIIEAAPRFYVSHATQPIRDIAPLHDQANFELGADNIRALDLYADGDAVHPFNAAFLDALESAGQYSDKVGGVSFVKGALFTINIALPANTPVGEYAVAVYLYRDGILISQDTAALRVNKVGLERRIFDLAHRRPVLYGLLCVAVSLLAGWIAGLAFRKS